MQTIDGKKIGQLILDDLKLQVADLPFQPVFCDVLVGQDAASAQYVRMKGRTAEKIGIKFQSANFPSSITTDQLVTEIQKLNRAPNMCGLIVQLPLPNSIDKTLVLNSIDEKIDVDCTGEANSKKFYEGASNLQFPTAAAVMALLDSLEIDFLEKQFLVLGRGQLVGRPVNYLIEQRGWKLSVANSTTQNTNELLKNADVIISATGRPKSITGEMLKTGCIVIDAGTSESQGGIMGDVDSDSVLNKASYLAPVPGGVGPVTVAMLLQNVVKVAKNIS